MLDNYGCRHTLRICNAYCCSTAKIVARTHHSITFYTYIACLVHCFCRMGNLVFNSCTIGMHATGIVIHTVVGENVSHMKTFVSVCVCSGVYFCISYSPACWLGPVARYCHTREPRRTARDVSSPIGSSGPSRSLLHVPYLSVATDTGSFWRDSFRLYPLPVTLPKLVNQRRNGKNYPRRRVIFLILLML
jgi:hypothetical protein